MTNFEWMKSDIRNTAEIIGSVMEYRRGSCEKMCSNEICREDCKNAVLEWLNKEYENK